MKPLFLALLALLLAAIASSSNAALAADKSQYTLFNPTPKELMREFNTDRPARVNSPFTVDAGHVQTESDLVSFIEDDANGETKRTWAYLPTYLKLGLLNDLDFQLLVEPYLLNETEVGGSTATRNGFGDLTFRFKLNLLGNDEGALALALTPFVKAPTATIEGVSDQVEGGLQLPLALKLPQEFHLELVFEYERAQNESDSAFHNELSSGISLHHDLGRGVAGYIEFFGRRSTEQGVGWDATVDPALQFDVADNVKLDVGVNIGVTDDADDLNAYSGASFRF